MSPLDSIHASILRSKMVLKKKKKKLVDSDIPEFLTPQPKKIAPAGVDDSEPTDYEKRIMCAWGKKK